MDRVAAFVVSIPSGSVRKPDDRDAMNVFADWCPAVVDGIAVDCDASAGRLSRAAGISYMGAIAAGISFMARRAAASAPNRYSPVPSTPDTPLPPRGAGEPAWEI